MQQTNVLVDKRKIRYAAITSMEGFQQARMPVAWGGLQFPNTWPCMFNNLQQTYMFQARAQDWCFSIENYNFTDWVTYENE